jgi:hypothetical protein
MYLNLLPEINFFQAISVTGSGLDLDSIKPADTVPEGAKMAHKNIEKSRKFMFLSAGVF